MKIPVFPLVIVSVLALSNIYVFTLHFSREDHATYIDAVSRFDQRERDYDLKELNVRDGHIALKSLGGEHKLLIAGIMGSTEALYQLALFNEGLHFFYVCAALGDEKCKFVFELYESTGKISEETHLQGENLIDFVIA